MSTYGPRTRDAKALQGVALPRRAMIALAAAVAIAAPMAPAGAGSSQTVLLSVTHSISEVAAQVGALGGRVLQSMPIADAMLVELPAGRIPTGATVLPDVPMKVNGTRTYYAATMPTYRDTIGATAAASGAGVTVALVDTGVADVASLPNVVHLLGSGDGYGHGTFLAGLIAGQGEFPGVAPGATILDVKVADDEGSTSLSQVLNGLQAVADNGTAQVLNISLSTGSPIPPQFDPLSIALERLWDRGVTVVTAAGNEGPDRGTVTSPGSDPLLLTVGALDEAATPSRNDDTVAEFSSRGTKHQGAKPDLVAPGVSVISLRSPGSIADTENSGSVVVGPNGEATYFRGSGTSMSAAVVSGAVASVLGTAPDLTPNAVKKLLRRTAYSSPALQRRDGAGAGALDLSAALDKAPKFATRAARWTNDEVVGDEWGPADGDAVAWAAFAAAWEAGDRTSATAAWAELTFQTQQWAARSWSMAVLYANLNMPEEEFQARSWSARSWSLDEWLARSWSARSWSEESWTYEEWLARSWSARSWSARSWSARSWSADEWLARSWSARSWSSMDWAARSWSARSWSARSWSARSWSDMIWSARSWSARSWSARSWSNMS